MKEVITIDKVGKFERKLSYKGFSFNIDKNDWECASCPICTELLTDEDMDWIATNLAIDFVELVDTYHLTNEEEIDEHLMEAYENLVERCDTFYYEDTTEEEWNVLSNPHKTRDVIEICDRIKNHYRQIAVGE